jgi:hypothetical protein
MYSGGSNFQNDLYQNIPSMALTFTMYTPTFGNGSFVIQPASPGEVQSGYPSIPYLPLEAMIYQQQASNPSVSPNNISGGGSSGTQNVSGQQTIQDSNGNTIYQAGYFTNGI